MPITDPDPGFSFPRVPSSSDFKGYKLRKGKGRGREKQETQRTWKGDTKRALVSTQKSPEFSLLQAIPDDLEKILTTEV